MSDVLVVSLLAFGVGLVSLLLSWRVVSIASFVSLGMGHAAVGSLALSGMDVLSLTFKVTSFGFLAYFLGAWIGGSGARRRAQIGGPTGEKVIAPYRPAPRRWGLTASLILILVSAHFALAGVPILKENVETARYDLMASGFFGLPSRAVLMLLPIAFMMSYAQDFVRVPDGRHLLSGRTRILLASLIASRVLMGFKGGIWEVVILMAAVLSTSPKAPRLDALVRQNWGIVILALAYAGFVAGRYATVAVSGGSLWGYFVQRLTIGSTVAADHLLMHGVSFPAPSLLTDGLYYVPRYLGLDPLVPNAFIKTLSASMFGLPEAWAGESVPVTPGLMARAYSDFGIIGATLLLALLGYFTSTFERRGRRYLIGGTVTATPIVTLCIHEVVTKGDLWYIALNYGAMYLFFTLATSVESAVRRILGGRRNWRMAAAAC